MKKGANYLVRKFLYRLVNGEYCRVDYFGTTQYLTAEFPSIAYIAQISPSFRVRMMLDDDREVVAWIDKYKNVMIRIIDKSIIQTIIDL